MRAVPTLSGNPPRPAESRSFRDNDLEAKLLGAFGQRQDLLFAIPRFVILGAIAGMLQAIPDEAVEQTR
jgi:hypothetical protein